MEKRIARLKAGSRNTALNAKSGKTRLSFAEAVGRKTDYSGGAKNAIVNMSASVTSRLGKLGEKISDMRIVIGSLMGSSRSIAASVKDGRTRVSFIKINRRKTA